MNEDKKIGDYIVLYDNEVYQIKNIPEVFKSNEYATQEQIKEYIKTQR